jgi:hypothetical protein
MLHLEASKVLHGLGCGKRCWLSLSSVSMYLIYCARLLGFSHFFLNWGILFTVDLVVKYFVASNFEGLLNSTSLLCCTIKNLFLNSID